MAYHDYYFLNNHSLLAGELGLSVISIGKSDPKKPYSEDIRKKVNYFTFSYLRKGSGTFESRDSAKTKIKEGDIFIQFPGVWCKYGPEKDAKWEEYWIEVSGIILKNYLKKKILTPKSPIIDIGRKPNLVKDWENAIEFVKQKDTGYKELMTGKALDILCKIFVFGFQKLNRDFTESELVVRNLIKVMNENISSTEHVKAFCKGGKHGYAEIKRMFRKHMDTTPDNYFNMLKIDEAKENLLYTKKTIKEVGDAVGILDPGYFSRTFKKFAGYSPIQFRTNFKMQNSKKGRRKSS